MITQQCKGFYPELPQEFNELLIYDITKGCNKKIEKQDYKQTIY
jgi:hypothetical protein